MPDYASLRHIFASAFAQHNRLLTLSWGKGAGIAENLLLPHRLKGREALSECYCFELECLAQNGLIPLKDLMGHGVEIAIHTLDGDKEKRRICGITTGVKKLGAAGIFTRYLLRIEPCLALLKKTRNARVWENRSLPGIVQEILEEKCRRNAVFADNFRVELQLSQACPKRPYRAMFGESEFAFIERSLREEGLHYAWRFEGGEKPRHVLVIFDDPVLILPACGQSAIRFCNAHPPASEDSIHHWEGHREFQTSLTSLSSYAPEPAMVRACAETTDLEQASNLQSLCEGMEEYDPQAQDYASDSDALSRYARVRQTGKDARSKTFHGHSTVRCLQAGTFFRYADHPDHAKDSAADREFLVLELTLEAVNHFDPSLHEALSAGSVQGTPSRDYSNTFTCVRRRAPLRPEFDPDRHGRPRVFGLQSAQVVGPKGEETYTDAHGRVRIRFPWQRNREHPECNPDAHACWVRVAFGSAAGPGWGMLHLPRIGQEVLVAFLDGDPDRPVIVGALHNGKHPPLAFSGQSCLPANHQISGMRSREYQGRRGSELLFDDTHEQLRARLATDHASSELNLGFLSHPRNREGGRPRGEGAELRSDASVALRGGKGVLLSAAAQIRAGGAHLDRQELLDLVSASRELLESLAGYAEKQPSAKPDSSGIQELEERLKQWDAGANTSPQAQGGERNQQLIAISAPDGLLAATKACAAIHAGKHLDLASEQHSHYTVGQTFSLNAGKGIFFSSHTGGMTALAHKDDARIEAKTGDIGLMAHGNIKIIAAENEVVMVAKKKITLIAGDAYLTLGEGNIELGCTGTLKGKAARKEWLGAASMQVDLPKVEVGKTERRIQKVRKDSGEPIPGMKYTLHLPDGGLRRGVTDAEGFTEVIESKHLQTIKIHFEDPD